MSDIVTYHEYSPNSANPSCLNTGDSGDGVVFDHVEPLYGEFMFIGRHSILEAVAALYGITPNEAEQRLSLAPPAAKKPVRKKTDEGTLELV
jgi:hypothetical protein